MESDIRYVRCNHASQCELACANRVFSLCMPLILLAWVVYNCRAAATMQFVNNFTYQRANTLRTMVRDISAARLGHSISKHSTKHSKSILDVCLACPSRGPGRCRARRLSSAVQECTLTTVAMTTSTEHSFRRHPKTVDGEGRCRVHGICAHVYLCVHVCMCECAHAHFIPRMQVAQNCVASSISR